MHSAHKIFDYRQKSEGGFVLIAALMAVMILMAVGFFSLTVTSQDILISSRLVGERKALSAAEAGMHEVCRLLNPNPLTGGPPNYGLPVTPQSIDSVYDKFTSYTTTPPVQSTTIPTIPLAGFDMSKAYVGSVYDTIVTGRDASYNSSVSIAIGTVFSPNPGDTQQGQL
jgi:hypothetical protein